MSKLYIYQCFLHGLVFSDTPLPPGPIPKEKCMILEECGIPPSSLVIGNRWMSGALPPPRKRLVTFADYILEKEEDYQTLRLTY